MKKIILSFILGIGFGAFSYAAHKPNNNEIQIQDPQKKEISKKEKVGKYDFSLFKFVKPATKKVETDSTQTQEKEHPIKAKDETTFNYEKPRTFFKFS